MNTRILRTCLLTMLAAAMPIAAVAQIPADLQTILQERLDAAREQYAYGRSGAVVSVSFPDGSQWTGSTGVNDRKAQTPLPKEGLFGSGSITKTYVAATILLMQEDGLLSLDDPVERWLPGLLPNGQEVVIRHLLEHTSGVPDFSADEEFFRGFATEEGDLERRWTPEELVAFATSLGSTKPGVRARHSNTNYTLLGMVIEAVSGTDVASEIRRRVLEPHGLRHTFFEWADELPTPVVHNYNGDTDWSRLPRTSMASAGWTAASMVASPQDVARWARLLFGGSVLNAASQAEVDKYARQKETRLGWSLASNGQVPGFAAIAMYLPRSKVAVSVIINEEVGFGSVEETYRDILSGLAENALHRHTGLFADVPRQNLVLLDEDEIEQVDAPNGLFSMGAPVAAPSGSRAAMLTVSPQPVRWRASAILARPVDIFGYEKLRLAVHPGDAEGSVLEVKLGEMGIRIVGDTADEAYRIDMGRKEWQVIEIPLAPVLGEYDESITGFGFFGNLKGTFYVDDIRLIAPTGAVTAVFESREAGTPDAFQLRQNYPNPFNSGTVIALELAADAQVTVAVYNLAGQRVATLVDGLRPAGSYRLHWDGRDASGRALASGHYLYRLRAGAHEQAHKLLLLR